MTGETDRKIAELLARAEQVFAEVHKTKTYCSELPVVLNTFNMYTGLLLAQQIGNLRDNQTKHEKALVELPGFWQVRQSSLLWQQ